jgi:hypothetical protein
MHLSAYSVFGPLAPLGAPVWNPFLNLLATCFRCLILPVPVVFRLLAFSLHSSAKPWSVHLEMSSSEDLSRLGYWVCVKSDETYIPGFWQLGSRRMSKCASGYGESDGLLRVVGSAKVTELPGLVRSI